MISLSERTLQRWQNDKAEGACDRRPVQVRTPWNRLRGLERQRLRDRRLAGVRNGKQRAGKGSDARYLCARNHRAKTGGAAFRYRNANEGRHDASRRNFIRGLTRSRQSSRPLLVGSANVRRIGLLTVNSVEKVPLGGLRGRHFSDSSQVQRRADEFPLCLAFGQSAQAELSEPEIAFYPAVGWFRQPFAFAMGLVGCHRIELSRHGGTRVPFRGVDRHVVPTLTSEGRT